MGLTEGSWLEFLRLELEALKKELDRVADQFNPIIRGFARSKLHDSVRPYDEVEFDEPSGTPRVHLGPQYSRAV